MISIDIKTNFPAVAAQLRKLPTDVGNKAMARALNRVIDTGRSRMAREISGEFNLPSSKVRERLDVRRASASGNAIRLSATLEASRRMRGRSMNVIAFLERSVSLAEARRRAKSGTLKDLRFRFKRTGGAKRIQGAFIGNQSRTVFRRVGKGRLPIQAVSTIDVPQMFNTRRLNEHVRKVMLERFEREFTREAAFYLSKVGR